jgi:hypothetical protein
MELDTIIEKFENTSSEKIILKITKGQWQDIYDGLCNIHQQSIRIDYVYFKHFATRETYSLILSLITNKIDTVLLNNNNFNVHVNMKSLSLLELEKHMDFIQNISKLLRDRYPNKLLKCFIYNAPFVFSQLFNIISFLIDKETLSKIELITNK